MATTAKKPTATKVVKRTTAKKPAKRATKAVKDTTAKGVLTETIVNRTIKYAYPKTVTDTLSKKSWRQKVRNKLKTLTLDIVDAKGSELKAAKQALKEYQDEVLLS